MFVQCPERGFETMTNSARPNRVRTLANAPIREALIDLRCELPEGQDAELLAKFDAAHREIESEFPDKANNYASSVSAELKEGTDPPVAATTALRGYHFRNPQGDKIVQFRLDGFTFNKLRPYTKWVQLRTEAETLWTKYRSLLSEVGVARVGVRYINEIQVPPGVGFETIFVEPLRQPLGFGQGRIRKSLERLEVSSHDASERTIVTRLAREEKSGFAVILDIDAFAVAPDGAFEDCGVWARIDELRNRKNEIFFSSLTANGIERYA